ncbi:uncharacterized protein LOC134527184 isoform X5 [Bacillus rossius redtenbacheri]|uniref:uncharacterized protein LOC134527184 isoform X5 n=1 Tax=Bacillus rossius redtenbacheri TaxID=93214 RepID=UPI002FDE2D7A
MPKNIKKAEADKMYYQRQRGNKPPKQAPKSARERMREYRARKKAMKEYRSINEHPVKPEPFETVFLNMKQEVEESEDDADGGWAASCAETVLLPVDMSGGGVAVKQEPGSGDDPTCEPLGVAVTYTDGKHLISTRPSSETSPSEDAARQ